MDDGRSSRLRVGFSPAIGSCLLGTPQFSFHFLSPHLRFLWAWGFTSGFQRQSLRKSTCYLRWWGVSAFVPSYDPLGQEQRLADERGEVCRLRAWTPVPRHSRRRLGAAPRRPGGVLGTRAERKDCLRRGGSRALLTSLCERGPCGTGRRGVPARGGPKAPRPGELARARLVGRVRRDLSRLASRA